MYLEKFYIIYKKIKIYNWNYLEFLLYFFWRFYPAFLLEHYSSCLEKPIEEAFK